MVQMRCKDNKFLNLLSFLIIFQLHKIYLRESAGHKTLVPQVIAELEKLGCPDIMVTVGADFLNN